MKYRLYTRSYSDQVLKHLGTPDSIFTPDEHAYAGEHEINLGMSVSQ